MRLITKCSTFAAAATTLAVFSASSAAAATTTSFVVPGSKPFTLIPFVSHDDTYDTALLNMNWYDYADSNVTLLDYPRSFPPLTGLTDPNFGDSVATGLATLNADVHNSSGPIVVTGLSQGTVLVDEEEALLAANPSTSPSPDDITFIVASDVTRSTPLSNSLLSYFPQVYIPGLNYTNLRPPVTPYHTIVIVGEYDMYSDFPDRPWNLLADVNSLFASQTVHADVAFSDPSQVPASNIVTTTNALGGTTTTYLVPTAQLPMLAPLTQLGVPSQVVDELNTVLKPVVDAAYSRNDQPGDLRPYLQTTDGLATLEIPALTTLETKLGDLIPKSATSTTAAASEAPVTSAATAIAKKLVGSVTTVDTARPTAKSGVTSVAKSVVNAAHRIAAAVTKSDTDTAASTAKHRADRHAKPAAEQAPTHRDGDGAATSHRRRATKSGTA